MIRAMFVCVLAAVLALGADLTLATSAHGVASVAPAEAPVEDLSSEPAGEELTGEPVGEDLSATSSPAATEPVQRLQTEAGQVWIEGTLMVGQRVTARTEGWQDGATFVYQWLLDSVPLDGATEAGLTIPPSAANGLLLIEVTGTAPAADPVTVRSGAGQVTPRPINATDPRITGTAAVGSRLTARVTGWSDGVTLSYQWFASGTPISRATARTLTLTSAQAGSRITVQVTGTLTGSSTQERMSAATTKVVTPGRVAIDGRAATGATLTARLTGWASGTRFTYQWFADGSSIRGATGRTLALTSRHSGRAITVAVAATRSGWTTIERTSAASQRVMRSTRPTISGTVSAGLTLRARPGTWTTGTTFRYQWYANGRVIRGATSATLRIARVHVGQRIWVRLSGSKAGHPTVSVDSARTSRVLLSHRPTISGQRAVGAVLTARAGTWTTGTSVRYQWYANGRAISGATARTYKISSARQHQRVTVTVTGRRSGYATVSRTSAQTPRIARVGNPSISGSPRVTHRLSARTGTWTTGTRFRYQWYVDGSAVRGATSRTFTLRSSHLGSTVRVRVTGSRSGYATFSRTTTATSRVTYPSRTAPRTRTTCPSWAPIKGNEDSMIYHLPGQRFYRVTHPEECFRTESAARAAGFRKSKV